MKIREELNEVTLNTDNPEINEVFNAALAQVFNQSYIKKIDRILKRKIDIKEVQEKGNVVAYNQSGKIFVNANQFFELDKTAQMRYLLHEFIHILQRQRGLILTKFKELRKISLELFNIVKRYSKHPPSVFLTGKNQNLGAGGKWEILSYFMNNSIDWDKISPEGRAKIITALKKAGIFNLNSKFWKRRIGDV